MKINPEIMSFAMAHPILTTIFGLGALAATAFAVKEVAPVAGKALDYMTANVQNGKPPLGEFGGAVRRKVEQLGDHGDANPTAIPGNPTTSQP